MKTIWYILHSPPPSWYNKENRKLIHSWDVKSCSKTCNINKYRSQVRFEVFNTENISLKETWSLGQQAFRGLWYAIQACRELTVSSGMTMCVKGGEEKHWQRDSKNWSSWHLLRRSFWFWSPHFTNESGLLNCWAHEKARLQVWQYSHVSDYVPLMYVICITKGLSPRYQN